MDGQGSQEVERRWMLDVGWMLRDVVKIEYLYASSIFLTSLLKSSQDKRTTLLSIKIQGLS